MRRQYLTVFGLVVGCALLMGRPDISRIFTNGLVSSRQIDDDSSGLIVSQSLLKQGTTSYSELSTGGSGLWDKAEHYPNGWSSLPWFGYFFELDQGWIYHLEHGFVYCAGESTTNMSLYDSGLQSWIWISSDMYPYLYKFGVNEGWYRYYPGGTCGSRWFWRNRNATDVLETAINKAVETPVPEGFSLVPSGEFEMGDSFSEGIANEVPVHTVDVSAFYIHQTEVTYTEYLRVLNWAIGQGLAEGGEHLVFNQEGDIQPLYVLYSNDHVIWSGNELVLTGDRGDYPCTYITWYGAMAYCHYRTRMEGLEQAVDLSDWTIDRMASGYRLPTEAEWEKAARGGLTGLRFSFGNTLYADLARWSGSAVDYLPVGSYPATGFDLYDMTGNVLEWCWDWFSEDYYQESPTNDPMGPPAGEYRAYRNAGGSAYYTRISSRSGRPPDDAQDFIGVRPVRTVTQ